MFIANMGDKTNPKAPEGRHVLTFHRNQIMEVCTDMALCRGWVPQPFGHTSETFFEKSILENRC